MSRSSDARRPAASGAANLLDAVEQELTGLSRPRVVLLARGPTPPLAARLQEAVPGAQLLVVTARDQPLARLHLRLTAHGPFDAVIDIAGEGAYARLSRLLFHAQPGGAYVVRPTEEGFVDEVESLMQVRDAHQDDASDQTSVKARDRAALADSLLRVEVGDGFVLIGHEVTTLALAHDHHLNALLGKGRLTASVLHTIPAATFTSVATRRSHGDGHHRPLPTAYDAPALHLRRWDDVVCLPSQIAVQAGVLLPASYPVRTQGRLGHINLEAWAPGFVRAPEIGDPRPLSGSFYYLDNQMRGHFGHVLAEQVPVTWGWERAVADDPEVRALVGDRAGVPMATWELDLLEAAGIPRDRVEVINGPVRVERLYTATPTASRGEYIHPESARTYGTVGQALAAPATERAWPSRVFLTRAPGNRTCRNRDEVEALHRRHGFEVVLPEEMRLADQVRMVREADVISGFAGSGMFQIAFAGHGKRVIAISSDAYHVHNEQTFADFLGHQLDLIWCRADVPRGERFDPRSFQSSYEFDFQREGVVLEGLLRALDEPAAGADAAAAPPRSDPSG